MLRFLSDLFSTKYRVKIGERIFVREKIGNNLLAEAHFLIWGVCSVYQHSSYSVDKNVVELSFLKTLLIFWQIIILSINIFYRYVKEKLVFVFRFKRKQNILNTF